MVVILDFNTVVRVNARAAELPVAITQCVFAHTVIVENERKPWLRPIKYLSAKARLAAHSPVGLPAVDNPGFDLQFVSGEPLNSQSVEEPWRVRGHVGGLICPVVEVVVTEEPNVRNENSGVNIEPMVHVEVIPCIGFRKVLVCSA